MDFSTAAAIVLASVIGIQNRTALAGALGLVKPEVAAAKTVEAASKRLDVLHAKAHATSTALTDKIVALTETRAELASAKQLEIERVHAKFDAMHEAISDRVEVIATKASTVATQRRKVAEIRSVVKGAL